MGCESALARRISGREAPMVDKPTTIRNSLPPKGFHFALSGYMQQLLDFLLHIDDQLLEWVKVYGGYTYLILFLIIFAETGLVFIPFLPGDSLLFAAGAVSAAGAGLDIWILAGLLTFAAVLGDTVNYHVGQVFGTRLPFIKKKHLEKTHAYFEKYGGKTIIFARFIPIVRTFAPFVAGMGAMNYSKFILYNIVGGVAWVFICLFAGYWFGGHPWVKKNFEIVVVAIVLISVLPMAVEFLRERHLAKKAKRAAQGVATDEPRS
jgi:membrane-associated protein